MGCLLSLLDKKSPSRAEAYLIGPDGGDGAGEGAEQAPEAFEHKEEVRGEKGRNGAARGAPQPRERPQARRDAPSEEAECGAAACEMHGTARRGLGGRRCGAAASWRRLCSTCQDLRLRPVASPIGHNATISHPFESRGTKPYKCVPRSAKTLRPGRSACARACLCFCNAAWSAWATRAPMAAPMRTCGRCGCSVVMPSAGWQLVTRGVRLRGLHRRLPV